MQRLYDIVTSRGGGGRLRWQALVRPPSPLPKVQTKCYYYEGTETAVRDGKAIGTSTWFISKGMEKYKND